MTSLMKQQGLILITGNDLKKVKVPLPKPKVKVVRKKGKKKIKMIPEQVDNIKFTKVTKKRGAY